MSESDRDAEMASIADSQRIAAYGDAMRYRDRTAVLEGPANSSRDMNGYSDSRHHNPASPKERK